MGTQTLATTSTSRERVSVRGVERSQIVQVTHAGRVPYADANSWQQSRAAAVAAGSAPEVVVLLEHDPVYTQGRRGGREHVLRTLSAPVIDTDRGGDITFHGPGQLIVWPILRVRERQIGIASYVRGLEEAARRTVAHFGIEAVAVSGRPGLWIGERKLASVGVRIQGGVSRHGLALNCDVDLAWFDDIRACGIEGASATSLSIEADRHASVEACAPILAASFSDVFGLRLSTARWRGGA